MRRHLPFVLFHSHPWLTILVIVLLVLLVIRVTKFFSNVEKNTEKMADSVDRMERKKD